MDIYLLIIKIRVIKFYFLFILKFCLNYMNRIIITIIWLQGHQIFLVLYLYHLSPIFILIYQSKQTCLLSYLNIFVFAVTNSVSLSSSPTIHFLCGIISSTFSFENFLSLILLFFCLIEGKIHLLICYNVCCCLLSGTLKS